MNKKGCIKIKRRKTIKLKQKNKLNCKTRKVKRIKNLFIGCHRPITKLFFFFKITKTKIQEKKRGSKGNPKLEPLRAALELLRSALELLRSALPLLLCRGIYRRKPKDKKRMKIGGTKYL